MKAIMERAIAAEAEGRVLNGSLFGGFPYADIPHVSLSVPLFANDVLARSDKIAHGELAADRGFDGRHIIDRWWLV